MKDNLTDILNKDCLFSTKRVSIENWNHIESEYNFKDLTESVLEIMTPAVTRSLPDGWQDLNTHKKAENWINDRKRDSYFYVIRFVETKKIIGFLFLYTENERNKTFNLRLGYLLEESTWRIGIGSELINGLIKWGKNTNVINSISGGVEEDNTASINVLLKNDFHKSIDYEMPKGTLLYKIDLKK